MVARRVAAHAMAGTALLLDVAFVLLLVPVPADQLSQLETTTIGGFVLGLTFPLVGWVIASRRPANSMGWIFLGVGLSQALDAFATQYATVGLVVAPGSLPAADVLSWVAVWAWAPGFTLLLTATVLLFPDGRPPTPRWRPVLWAAGAATFLLVVPVAIAAWPFRGEGLLGSGPGLGTQTDPIMSAMVVLQSVGLILLLASGIASIAGLVVRFRRSTGTERAQLEWFVAAGVTEIVVLVVVTLLAPPASIVGTVLAAAISPLLPLAAAVAILRYHLYDIDRIVSRTVSYGVVTGLLAVLFAGLVLGLQGLLAPFTAGNGLAVAASTLVVAAAFQPLRARVQRVVDRRFDRARYDAEAVVTGFVDSVRDQVELEALAGEVVAVARRSVAPASVSVWLRQASGR
jgi:hypothetical protein